MQFLRLPASGGFRKSLVPTLIRVSSQAHYPKRGPWKHPGTTLVDPGNTGHLPGDKLEMYRHNILVHSYEYTT